MKLARVIDSLVRLAAIAVVLAVLGAAFAAAVALADVAEPRAVVAQETAESLTCQCGCGLTVANCNHPNCSFSVPVKDQIDAMVGRGMGRAQIVAFFRNQYGEKILSAPTTHGFNLLAWITPFAALLIGGGLVMLVLGRWRSTAPLSDSPPTRDPSAPEFAPALRERLRRDLRKDA